MEQFCNLFYCINKHTFSNVISVHIILVVAFPTSLAIIDVSRKPSTIFNNLNKL